MLNVPYGYHIETIPDAQGGPPANEPRPEDTKPYHPTKPLSKMTPNEANQWKRCLALRRKLLGENGLGK